MPNLLPRSNVPLIPAELSVGGDLWYEPPLLPQPGEAGYSVITMDWTAPGVDFAWPNRARTGKPDPWLGAFETLVEAPQWHADAPEPHDFAEIMIGLTHTVSERVLDVFLKFDESAVKYREIDIRFKGGTPSRRRYFWMHVTRALPAIDFANSRIRYLWPKRSRPYPGQHGPVRLMPDIEGIPYLCATTLGSRAVFISDEMLRTFRGIEPRLAHFEAQDISGGFTF
ncbi:DUF1629 domain-containing protein [Sphingomonas sp. LY54]|uniref:imm11 family protein n=1 Tax=Sphingomonas sp. LY54 TaxID=3095343 RepID=UPI002D76C7B4|nr:DUF1629 domain-containing protein [Sphingomonas sp. LY54]WRP29131.1 DUF1629 domain-containing protein [Sphingomonas sp. LY54]